MADERFVYKIAIDGADKAEQDLDGVNAATGRATQSFQKMDATTKLTAENLKGLSNKVKTLSPNLINASEGFNKVTQSTVNWGYVVGDLGDALAIGGLFGLAITGASTLLGVLVKSLSAADAETKKYSQTLELFQRQAALTTEQIKELQDLEKSSAQEKKGADIIGTRIDVPKVETSFRAQDEIAFREESIRLLEREIETTQTNIDALKERYDVAVLLGKEGLDKNIALKEELELQQRILGMDQQSLSNRLLEINALRERKELLTAKEIQDALMAEAEAERAKAKAKREAMALRQKELQELRKAQQAALSDWQAAKAKLDQYGAILGDAEKQALAGAADAAEQRARELGVGAEIDISITKMTLDKRLALHKEHEAMIEELRKEHIAAEKRKADAVAALGKKQNDMMIGVAQGAFDTLGSTIMTAMQESANGQEEAAARAAASFLTSTGSQLVGAGTKAIFEGAIISANPLTPGMGAGMIATGVAAIGAGLAMGGVGARVGASANAAGAQSPGIGGAGSFGEATTTSGVGGTSSAQGSQGAQSVTIVNNYGASGPSARDQARELVRLIGVASSHDPQGMRNAMNGRIRVTP